LCERLTALVAVCGHAVVNNWIAQIHAGHIEAVVRSLLTTHYDPGYAKSTRHNFQRFDMAFTIAASDRSTVALTDAARQILLHCEPNG
jgi:tRNA 2-selenouridine synthase